MVRQREASSGAQRPPIALYGYSMGAFLGLAAASDRDVAAVVEQAGGIWQNRTLLVGRLPPVLIIHGRRDRRVPYEQYCVPLQQTLRAKGAPFETRIFDQGHGFDPRAEAQARSATVEFLRRHLEAPIAATFVRKPGQSGSGGTIQ
jgi:predicted esterase